MGERSQTWQLYVIDFMSRIYSMVTDICNILLLKQNTAHTLAALKRYFPASLVAPLPNSEQINHPSSNHIYIKSIPNHIHHHYTPSVTLTRHTSSLQLHPHSHHFVTPGFVGRPRRSDCPAGQMDGQAAWWARVHGSG